MTNVDYERLNAAIAQVETFLDGKYRGCTARVPLGELGEVEWTGDILKWRSSRTSFCPLRSASADVREALVTVLDDLVAALEVQCETRRRRSEDVRARVDAISELPWEWRALVGRHYPAMALVEVAGLLEEGALVEIQAVAAIP